MHAIERISNHPGVPFSEEWYDVDGEGHFWFQWRHSVLVSMMKRLGLPVDAPLRCMEVGCGAGSAARAIERSTSWTVDGVDLNEAALARCKGLRGRVMFYDVMECKGEFIGKYDVIFVLDVLEHIENVDGFLRAVLQHLKPDGVCFVNVPALPALYGCYDRCVGHLRRYTAGKLVCVLQDSGADVLVANYWGFPLVPVVVLRNLMARDPATVVKKGFEPQSPLIHALLRCLMTIEITLLRRVPVGSSIMAALVKSDSLRT